MGTVTPLKKKRVKKLGEYGPQTIEDMLKFLQTALALGKAKKQSRIYLSDFEYNGFHREFEMALDTDTGNILIYFEMHGEEWPDEL